MSKQITVRYFAAFRERAGTDAENLRIEADTARDVFERVRDRIGTAEPLAHCKVAVNDELVGWDARVEDGDTVLLFPPVAGG
ncbi:MAG TPA: MoaD/ThiS family protein [Woeseiaceae bacterium]|nr:MoaD/ThiS family protein [Woeseiaceae bacterium]